jgi:hypothetical protein
MNNCTGGPRQDRQPTARRLKQIKSESAFWAVGSPKKKFFLSDSAFRAVGSLKKANLVLGRRFARAVLARSPSTKLKIAHGPSVCCGRKKLAETEAPTGKENHPRKEKRTLCNGGADGDDDENGLAESF